MFIPRIALGLSKKLLQLRVTITQLLEFIVGGEKSVSFGIIDDFPRDLCTLLLVIELFMKLEVT